MLYVEVESPAGMVLSAVSKAGRIECRCLMNGQKSCVELLVGITVHQAGRGTSYRRGCLWIGSFAGRHATKATRNEEINLPTSAQKGL